MGSAWAAAAKAGVLVLRQRLEKVHRLEAKDEMKIGLEAKGENKMPTWQGRRRQRAGTSSLFCKYHVVQQKLCNIIPV